MAGVLGSAFGDKSTSPVDEEHADMAVVPFAQIVSGVVMLRLDRSVGGATALGHRGSAKAAQQRGQALGRDFDPAAVTALILGEGQANLSSGKARPRSSIDGSNIVSIGGMRAGSRPQQACREEPTERSAGTMSLSWQPGGNASLLRPKRSFRRWESAIPWCPP